MILDIDENSFNRTYIEEKIGQTIEDYLINRCISLLSSYRTMMVKEESDKFNALVSNLSATDKLKLLQFIKTLGDV